jgi:hypothetical protein
MKWQEQAAMAYANDTEEKRNKAIAAGKAMDNALDKSYSTGNEQGHGAGVTKSHFMTDNWLKYFSYEALGGERVRLLHGGK